MTQVATKKKATNEKRQEKRTGEPAQRIAAALELLAGEHTQGRWIPYIDQEPAQRIADALEAIAEGRTGHPPEAAEAEGQGEGASEVADAPTGA